MKKFSKVILIIAASCIALGLCLGFAGYAAGAGSGVTIRNGKVEVVGEGHGYTFNDMDIEDVTDIEIDVYNAKIEFVSSGTDKFTVDVNLESSDADPVVSTDNGKIKISDKNGGFSFNFNITGWLSFFDEIGERNIVTIGIPDNAVLNRVKLDTSNGSIDSNVEYTVKQFDADTSNGHIFLYDIACTDEFEAKTSNGSVECNGEFGADAYFKSSNGKVTVEGTFDGDVECKTSNGAISFTTKDSISEYDIDADTSNGKVWVNDQDHEDSYWKDNGASKKVTLKTSNGRIESFFGR